MPNYITYNSNRYIESKNIKVFPCAYRGYYGEGESKVFDPEARSTTESNFTDTFHKLSLNKESYVVSWNSSILKCVIGGYYFEIYNHNEIEDWFDANYNPYYLCIQTQPIEVGTDPDADGTRKTEVLKSFVGAENYLDVKVTTENGNSERNGYIFTGLALKSAPEDSDIYLTPFKVLLTEAGKISAANSVKNNIGKYYKVSETSYNVITAETVLENDTKIYNAPTELKLNPTELSVISILDTSSGKFAIRMRDKDDANSTIASGDYSIALGCGTEASSKGAFAVGIKTKASGESSIAVGNFTEATGEGSVALGSNTKATAPNQVVIGKYNKEDSNQAFIIANGTSSRAVTNNKFTVSYQGDVASTGNLNIGKTATINGNLTALGNVALGPTSADSLILGKTGINSFLWLCNPENTPVFTVAPNGNVAAAGKMTSASTTVSDSATTLTTKDYVDLKVSNYVSNAIAGKADATNVAADLAAAVDAAKAELKTYNDSEIAKAVEAAKEELSKSMTDKFASTTATSGSAIAGSGKYIQSITQTNGQVTATDCSFETALDSTNDTNAPTSKAVAAYTQNYTQTYTNNFVSTIWNAPTVKLTTGAGAIPQSLKSIILDAAYPKGSIYTMYSINNVTSCPIASTLGGTWEPLKAEHPSDDTKTKTAGFFLCAADPNNKLDSEYYRGKIGGYEEAQLKAHYHELERNSNNLTKTTTKTASNGAHTHSFSLKARAHDASTDIGLRSGNPDGGCHQWTFNYTTDSAGSHEHSIDLTNIKTAYTGADISTTPGTNLPPYVAVYMWVRTA